MFAQFNHFEIEMTKQQAEAVSHPGPCDADVSDLVRHPKIRRQLAKISDKKLACELAEYSDWDVTDREANEERIIWLAGGMIMDELYEKKRGRK